MKGHKIFIRWNLWKVLYPAAWHAAKTPTQFDRIEAGRIALLALKKGCHLDDYTTVYITLKGELSSIYLNGYMNACKYACV